MRASVVFADKKGVNVAADLEKTVIFQVWLR